MMTDALYIYACSLATDDFIKRSIAESMNKINKRCGIYDELDKALEKYVERVESNRK